MGEIDLKSLFEQFKVSGTCMDISPTGSGHIHTTFLVRTIEENEPDYIIQKINHKVFPPVAEMMNNIKKVTNHIREKRKSNSNLHILEIIETHTNKTFFTDIENNHWRLYKKIPSSNSYDVVPNSRVAYEAGKAYGQFLADLRDMSSSELFPVIPDFHSMEVRYQNFLQAMKSDPVDRVKEVGYEIDFVNTHIDKMLSIPRLEREGKLPSRITHNDTKINNVLFDKNGYAICVIDLDTVMPGLSLYDFGDTIRTAANTSHEDEPDLDRIQFNLPVFKSFSEGFLSQTLSFLTTTEIEHLTLSAQYMTFIMGLRFLTDYISGDVYYAIHHPKQNLRRCKAQFRLMMHMIDNYKKSQKIIMQLVEEFQIK